MINTIKDIYYETKGWCAKNKHKWWFFSVMMSTPAFLVLFSVIWVQMTAPEVKPTQIPSTIVSSTSVIIPPVSTTPMPIKPRKPIEPIEPVYSIPERPKYSGAYKVTGRVRRCYKDGVAIESNGKLYFLFEAKCPDVPILYGYIEETFRKIELDFGRQGRQAIVVIIRDKETAQDDRKEHRTSVRAYPKELAEYKKNYRKEKSQYKLDLSKYKQDMLRYKQDIKTHQEKMLEWKQLNSIK